MMLVAARNDKVVSFRVKLRRPINLRLDMAQVSPKNPEKPGPGSHQNSTASLAVTVSASM